ncbi:MAG: peptidoglycan D,D-transpeptidase FtsI family protein [Bdellovibrionales bacterium]
MKSWRRLRRAASSRQPSLPGLFSSFVKTRRLATPHEQAVDLAHTRLPAALFVFTLAWAIIGGRLVDLTLFNDMPELPLARAEPGDLIETRADIRDRNGVVLATSIPTSSLCANTKKLIDPDEAARQLLAVLPDLDKAKLDEDFRSGKHCVIVRRHLSPRQMYEINRLGIAGLDFQPDEGRLYPAGNIAAHVVGFTNIDSQGLGGVEKYFDMHLDEQQEPVTLAMDLRLQNILRDELAGAMAKFSAIGAGGLIMDIRTGEILAMTSLPDFDPARPGEASDSARFNRDTLGVYEMGSTFKIFTTAMALDSGLIHIGDTFNTIDPIEIGGQTIRDFEKEKHWLNVAEIFTRSSNIGAAHMAERMGTARQRAFLTQLGLTEKAPLEVPEVGSPLLPSNKAWGEAATMTVSFGHGIAVNAVQLTAAVATIVNDGVRVRPTLLKVTGDTPGNRENERVISPRTSAVMRGLMRLVVTRGTAKGAEVPGYMLGGKTGTAEKLVNKRYSSSARLSSFMGVFPMNAPRYAIFAMLDEPKGNANTYGFATGGMVVAPTVGHIVSRIGPLLNQAPLDADMAVTVEKQILKPLGAVLVDGAPVDEGFNYASNESHSGR